MTIRKTVHAAVIATLTSLASASAWAGGPVARTIDLGAVHGVAYYTEEAGSFRVVATVAQRDGQPIRVETMLAPGQSIVLSTADGRDVSVSSVELSMKDNDLQVRPVATTN